MQRRRSRRYITLFLPSGPELGQDYARFDENNFNLDLARYGYATATAQDDVPLSHSTTCTVALDHGPRPV